MHIIISNHSGQPIYEQIKEQIKAQIFSGEINENEMLPSLRQLARDLKISVLTATKAYSELEREGYISGIQGKGFTVMPSSSALMREQFIKEAENGLNSAIQAARRADMSDEEIISLLKLLLEVEDD